MFTFLLIVQTLIAASLVTVILMQRSEGGGLGVGGSSSGFMTARGAADFLTRSTAVLASLFVVMSIVLAGGRRLDPPAGPGRHLAGQPERSGRCRPRSSRSHRRRSSPAEEAARRNGIRARPVRAFFAAENLIRALA